MKLRPIKDRILVKLEPPSTETASGLVLMEHRKPEQTGTVIAVGPCAHPRREEACELAAKVDEWAKDWRHGGGCGIDDFGNDTKDLLATSDLLRDLVRPEPAVKVGDYVVFSWTAGQEIWVEDGEERYLLMRESDVLCVVEGLE